MKIKKNKEGKFQALNLDISISVEGVDRDGCYLKVKMISKDGLSFDFSGNKVYVRNGNSLILCGINAPLGIEDNTILCSPKIHP